MENVDRWYFTKEQLADSPSKRCDIDEKRELSYRQQAANFIQDMGQRLAVSQLCINTAIAYMHRFYVFHSFTDIHRNNLSVAALFLAAKVEEQPRKLEHVIKVAHVCLHKESPPPDVRSEAYSEKMFEVVAHENILLQTLGFVLAIEHPHTYVVKVCTLVKASKDLAQLSYIMATTSLHMTTMCLQYKPTVVACVCIHLACKWSDYLIEPCTEGRDWFFYVDRTMTWENLEKLTSEFIAILETSPHRFKRKLGNKDLMGGYHGPRSLMEIDPKEKPSKKEPHSPSMKKEPHSPVIKTAQEHDSSKMAPKTEAKVESMPTVRPSSSKRPCTPPLPPPIKKELGSTQVLQPPPKKVKSLQDYREKREKEKLESKSLTPEPKRPAALTEAMDKTKYSREFSERSKHMHDSSDRSKHLPESANRSKHLHESSSRSKHSHESSDKNKHVPESSDKSKYFNAAWPSDKHLPESADKDKHLSESLDKSKHFHGSSEKNKHFPGSSDKNKHVSEFSDKSRHSLEPSNKNKHLQESVDRSKHSAELSDRHKHPQDSLDRNKYLSAARRKKLSHAILDECKVLAEPDKGKCLPDSSGKSKNPSSWSSDRKNVQDSSDMSKHLQASSEKSRHFQDSLGKPKHSVLDDDSPHRTKHLQDSSDRTKHLQQSSDIIKHLQAPSSVTKHLQASSDRNKHLQASSDRTKHFQASSDVNKHLQASADRTRPVRDPTIDFRQSSDKKHVPDNSEINKRRAERSLEQRSIPEVRPPKPVDCHSTSEKVEIPAQSTDPMAESSARLHLSKLTTGNQFSPLQLSHPKPAQTSPAPKVIGSHVQHCSFTPPQTTPFKMEQPPEPSKNPIDVQDVSSTTDDQLLQSHPKVNHHLPKSLNVPDMSMRYLMDAAKSKQKEAADILSKMRRKDAGKSAEERSRLEAKKRAMHEEVMKDLQSEIINSGKSEAMAKETLLDDSHAKPTRVPSDAVVMLERMAVPPPIPPLATLENLRKIKSDSHLNSDTKASLDKSVSKEAKASSDKHASHKHSSKPKHMTNSHSSTPPLQARPSTSASPNLLVKANGAKDMNSISPTVIENNVKSGGSSSSSSSSSGSSSGSKHHRHHHEKSRHKSKHSSRERPATPASNNASPGESLKVTIKVKDLISLPTKTPGIKIKPLQPPPPPPVGLKLVLTKDGQGYSASARHMEEKSRKRSAEEHHPNAVPRKFPKSSRTSSAPFVPPLPPEFVPPPLPRD